MRDNPDIGVYIHIPFCRQKCVYCDFYSTTGQDYEPYADYIIDRIKSAPPYTVATLYIGGGTPTALPPALLCKILNAATTHFNIHPNAEITVEANPCTLNKNYLQALKQAGVNRLSIGLQSTHDHHLKTLGRLHTYADFIKSYNAAIQAGFTNINIDLMFGLPSQTFDEWRQTISDAIALAPQHISAYSLTPAENTPLWRQIESKTVTLPSEESDRQMYHALCETLAENGYTHYEISNFCKDGYQSRHNTDCWQMKPYIGFGSAAHSFINNTRIANSAAFPPTAQTTPLTEADLISETIFLGLRLTDGICEDAFAARHGSTPTELYKTEIPRLIDEGLIIRNDTRLRLTPKGFDLSNRVFSVFVNCEFS